MKTETLYICEICGSRYADPSVAMECEAHGVPDESKIPIGMMHSYEHHGYVGIFAVAKISPSYSKHSLNPSFWAFRGPGYPPYSLDEDLCGASDSVRTSGADFERYKKSRMTVKNRFVGNAEFVKMIQYLQSKGITPQYYTEDGALIVVK